MFKAMKPTFRFLEFLQEADGSYSCGRLLLLIWGAGCFAGWAILSVRHGVLVEVPQSLVYVLGALVAGKAVQRFPEQFASPPASVLRPLVPVPPAGGVQTPPAKGGTP
jgi:hypothetical protein